MEAACVCHIKAHNFSTIFPPNRTLSLENLPTSSLRFNQRKCNNYNIKNGVAAIGCVALGSPAGSSSSPSMVKNTEEEEEEEEEEWMKMGSLREKCKERRGMVELLECLEREAIMGDDEGKDPTDYNRRAQIFDKSSRVFQALKDRNES